MSYLVMECHPGYAVLLDEEGRFRKAANLQYEVGQTVYNPVLMNEAPEKQRHTARWISSGIAAIAACFLLFLGLGYYQNYMRPYSSIYLTINPEVQMDLNRQGTVVGLTGTNEDGKRLLEGYSGKGKDKVTAADELIDRAIAMGFLSDGGQVSFSIDSPDDALFQEYGTELRTKVTEHLDGRITITIEIVNHNDGQENPETGSPPSAAPPTATQPASTSPSASDPSLPEVAPPTSSRPTGYDDPVDGPGNGAGGDSDDDDDEDDEDDGGDEDDDGEDDGGGDDGGSNDDGDDGGGNDDGSGSGEDDDDDGEDDDGEDGDEDDDDDDEDDEDDDG